MKKITVKELKSILESHKLWRETLGEEGIYANLRDADLADADLTGAYLEGANLQGANFCRANLKSANLKSANLRCANLVGANLTSAYLRYTDLTGANLTSANLVDANLTDADLTGTVLEKKKEQGTTMILSEEETAAILKMRADKGNKAKIDARDIVIEVITLVTLELSNNQPSNTLIMRTNNCDEVLGSENLETISQILDLMGVKFQALTANRRAINFSYKKLNSL